MLRSAYAAGYREGLTKIALSESTQHILELGGLGLLGIPVVHHLLGAEKPMDKGMAGVELAGLGALAIPSLAHMAR